MAKDVLTTGDVAKICRVAPRTVCKWCDVGHLASYRIAGAADRRIVRDRLAEFMAKFAMPLHWLTEWERQQATKEPP